MRNQLMILLVGTAIFTMSLSTHAQISEKVKEKPKAIRPAYATVTLHTQKKAIDGAQTEVEEVLCEMNLNAVVYDAKNAENETELELPKFLRTCNVRIGLIDAKVVLYPIIYEGRLTQVSAKIGTSDNAEKVPYWIKNLINQPTKAQFQAYTNVTMILPFSYSLDSKQPATGKTSEDFMKLMEMFGDINSTQSSAIVDDGSSITNASQAVSLTTTIKPSSKYCSEHSNDSICSANYTISTSIVFKGKQ